MCNHGENNPDQMALFSRYKRYYKNGKTDGSGSEAHKGNFLNGFGNPILTIIKQEQPDILSLAKWGFVPEHITSEQKAREFVLKYTTLNAKAETVFQLPTFKKAIWTRRCLVTLTAFYEWMHVNKGKKIEKIPHRIKLKDEEIFSFGGIYEVWKDEVSGRVTTTFAILTVIANPMMEEIHNTKKRMPLIFDKETEEKWLDNSLDENGIKALMVPLDEKKMEAYTVAKINFNSKDFDPMSEQIKAPFDYGDLKNLNNPLNL